MKKAALFLTSLVSLSLLLSGCQPEDKDLAGTPEVANQCPRCKIKGKPQTKQQNNGARGPGFFALSAVMVEKQVEAVQLVRLAMGLDNSETSGFSVDNTRGNGMVTLVSDSKPQEYQTEQGGFKTSVKKSLTASVPVNPTDGVLVDIVAGKFSQTVDRLEQKQYLNWNEDSYTLKLEESKAPDELILSMITAGTFRSAAGLVPFGLGVVMRVDKASFKTGKIKVLEAKNRMAYKFKPTSKETVIELQGTNHEIAYNGQCYSLNSESTILTDKAKKKLVYKDSAAEVVGSSFKTSAADCESRPTVDLSRTFVF